VSPLARVSATLAGVRRRRPVSLPRRARLGAIFWRGFGGVVSAAHFGISGRTSIREAETGFDSRGDWFAVARQRFHQLPRMLAAAIPAGPTPPPSAKVASHGRRGADRPPRRPSARG